MNGFGLTPALALLLLLFSSTAWAEFGVPYVTPSSPVAGETLSVNIYVYQQEYCDGIFSAPGYPKVTQEGNAITFTFFGTRYESMGTCAYMPGAAKRSFGSYQAGSYTLTVKLDYINGGGARTSPSLGRRRWVLAIRSSGLRCRLALRSRRSRRQLLSSSVRSQMNVARQSIALEVI